LLPLPSFGQALIATAALVCATVLGALDKLDASAISAIYSAVIFGAIGHVNGQRIGMLETRGRGGHGNEAKGRQ
jgi:hypothetical protein